VPGGSLKPAGSCVVALASERQLSDTKSDQPLLNVRIPSPTLDLGLWRGRRHGNYRD